MSNSFHSKTQAIEDSYHSYTYFTLFLFLGLIFIFLSFFYVPLVIIYPQKFISLFTLGSLMIIISLAMITGNHLFIYIHIHSSIYLKRSCKVHKKFVYKRKNFIYSKLRGDSSRNSLLLLDRQELYFHLHIWVFLNCFSAVVDQFHRSWWNFRYDIY